MFSNRVIAITMYFITMSCISGTPGKCSHSSHKLCTSENLIAFSKNIVIPDMEGKRKGETGKIGIIGGSAEYTGAPYFAALTSLKIGADLVYVITTEVASPVIKSYSPDLIVYPLLNSKFLSKITSLLKKMDVIIIVPGLGREHLTMTLIYDIILACRDLKKPMIIDADGLYAVSKNLSILNSYPSPGVILTPNHRESEFLRTAVQSEGTHNNSWYYNWGETVTVVIKGKEDHYYGRNSSFEWAITEGGSGRRSGGQGDILSGALGTFYNWALQADFDGQVDKTDIAKVVATYAAAKFTRACNYNAFLKHGRSMTASDMLEEIHKTFDEIFV